MGQKISEKQMKEEIRSVVRQNIKEVTTNDWHYKAIMAIWDKGGSFTRKKIGTILLKDPKADRRDVEDALRNSGYDEVTDVTDRLRIEGVIKEGEDNIPGGLAKGMTLNDIAEKHGMSVDMLVAEFKKGIQTEMEHTTDREMAKEITLDHLFEDPQYYTKLATVEEYVDDKGVEHVAAALPQTEEEPLKEATANANILGIDFNISQTDFRIFFGFKNKKEASIKVRQIGSNKIVNVIQNALDKAYGKGEFFFRGGTHSEIQNGYYFERKENSIDLNKLKFEGVIKEEDYTETPEETLEGLKEMAMGNLERIEDYAEMISDRMKEGQELDSWMYSQITLAVDQLNSVHDTMDGTDGKKEEIKEEKVYIDYLNKQKGFKQDRIKFNSYEEAVKWARKNFEKFNPDMIKYESVNEYNVNKKFGSKYDIGAGSMGSGTIFWNRAEEEFGDYKKIAHVSDSGKITFYDKKLPSFVKKHVEDYAKTQNESINELTGNERQIKNGNPNNIFYIFYKGQFAAEYWAMNPTDLFNIYWDEFKVRRPAGSKFKLNPEFIIVPKKEYDNSTSNRYAKLKPYVDKFWDKLQNESVNEGTEPDIIAQIKDIAKKHQNNIVIDPKSGKKMRVDAFSASAIATVYDALSDSSKEKFLASGLLGMQQMAMKLLKK
jgi:hypothetical protein